MTFDIGLHEVCVRVGVRYVITKFSRMDSLPNFLTHGAPLRARESSAMMMDYLRNGKRAACNHGVIGVMDVHKRSVRVTLAS